MSLKSSNLLGIIKMHKDKESKEFLYFFGLFMIAVGIGSFPYHIPSGIIDIIIGGICLHLSKRRKEDRKA